MGPLRGYRPTLPVGLEANLPPQNRRRQSLWLGALVWLGLNACLLNPPAVAAKLKIKHKSSRDHEFAVAIHSFSRAEEKLRQRYSWSSQKGFSQVIYGNDAIGYFQTNVISTPAGPAVELIPPSYRDPIRFYGVENGQPTVDLGKATFPNPIPELVKSLVVEVEGKPSQTFFGVTAAIEDAFSTNVAHFALLFNKLGEVVAYHFPGQGEMLVVEATTLQRISPTAYLLSVGQGKSYVERFEFGRRKPLRIIKPARSLLPFAVGTDILCADSACQDYLTVDQTIAHLRPGVMAWDQILANPSWQNMWRFWEKPLRIEAAVIKKVKPDQNHGVVVWNSLEHFSPLDSESLQQETAFDPNLSRANYLAATEKPQVWAGFGPKAHFGWADAKSLTATEEGYLIAFNGLKRVAHVEKYFRDVLWTAGNTGDNDHVLAGESALRQLRFAHYEQNKLFAIDVPALADMSGERGAELLVHPIGKSQSSPWRFRPEEPLLGVSGGSIKLVGEKILAYLPAMDAGYDYIFEIDPNTRKAITQIRVGNAYSWPGTRLHSGHTLGAEQYLGERPTLVH